MAPRRRRLPHDPGKVCDSCRHLKRPLLYCGWRLIEICKRIAEAGIGDIQVEDLSQLVQEVLTLKNRVYWCMGKKLGPTYSITAAYGSPEQRA